MVSIQEVFEDQRGLATQVAQACGITLGAVSQWDRVPVERVLVVERVTGIPRHELRPDIYPAEDAHKPQAAE